jgi:hypothetical protein
LLRERVKECGNMVHRVNRYKTGPFGIMDGGAAMTAYARMQFTQMPDAERQRIQDSLLKYCELDTLAIGMICEGWREEVG